MACADKNTHPHMHTRTSATTHKHMKQQLHLFKYWVFEHCHLGETLNE